MLRKSREEILKDFKAQVAQGKILVGVGAGTGITAKCSEKADVDMLIIYNSGRFRMAGRGSLSGILSYGDGTGSTSYRKENSSTCRCMWYRPIPCNGYFLKTVKRAGI